MEILILELILKMKRKRKCFRKKLIFDIDVVLNLISIFKEIIKNKL